MTDDSDFGDVLTPIPLPPRPSAKTPPIGARDSIAMSEDKTNCSWCGSGFEEHGPARSRYCKSSQIAYNRLIDLAIILDSGGVIECSDVRREIEEIAEVISEARDLPALPPVPTPFIRRKR